MEEPKQERIRSKKKLIRSKKLRLPLILPIGLIILLFGIFVFKRATTFSPCQGNDKYICQEVGLRKIQNALKDPENTLELDLSKAELSFLTAEIIQLKNLKELSLSENKLKNLPENLGKLQYLRKLDLSFNQISEFPGLLTKLDNLEELNYSGNQLTGIPETIGNLKKLKKLKLNFNLLESLPVEIGNLVNLEELDISENNLKGLPQELSYLTGLKRVLICPNSLDVKNISRNILSLAMSSSLSNEKEVLTETVQKGEGIIGFERRVLEKYLDNLMKTFFVKEKQNVSATNTCVNQFLQKNLTPESIHLGEKKTLSSVLIKEAIISCGMIKSICGQDRN
jgi:Leucine-rich repeat (LRR) protein